MHLIVAIKERFDIEIRKHNLLRG